jgi:hypothetical protein
LKINSTLALIGAIVAEFFGTPIVGMGFRISTEVGRMNVDMVWASIAVAALAGSLFYGLVALVERVVTFWHPSVEGNTRPFQLANARNRMSVGPGTGFFDDRALHAGGGLRGRRCDPAWRSRQPA